MVHDDDQQPLIDGRSSATSNMETIKPFPYKAEESAT